jgi:hypothetical protein
MFNRGRTSEQRILYRRHLIALKKSISMSQRRAGPPGEGRRGRTHGVIALGPLCLRCGPETCYGPVTADLMLLSDRMFYHGGRPQVPNRGLPIGGVSGALRGATLPAPEEG